MNLKGEKTTFSPHPSGYLIDTASQPSLSMRSTLSGTSDSLDDPDEDRARPRTFLHSSWASHGISTSQIHHNPYIGAHKSVYPSFSKSKESEQSLRKSRFQDQYWAYAIPDTLPPCPDRKSPHWDPNKEYQDLLDYTYPIHPKYHISKQSEDTDSDPFFNDSGIDLDSYNISCDNKLNSTSMPYQEHKKERYSRTNLLSSQYAFSTPFKTPVYQRLHNPSESSNEMSFEEHIPCASKSDLVKESRYDYLPKYTMFESTFFTTNSVPRGNAEKSSCFIPTSKILLPHKDVDSDEEYMRLPSNLKELESLATHLKDLSLGAGKNRYSDYGQDGDSRQNWQSFGNTEDLHEPKKGGEYEHGSYRGQSLILDESSIPHAFPDISGCSPMQTVQGAKTLIQSIQKFCLELEKLIQWLYGVAETVDNWIAPKPDVESIQSALSLYLKFKKDIAEHQGLAETVVKNGELLLKYMSVNSSVLKDTLVLISKQSGELEKHSERLYASVLEAMDTVTDDSLGRNSNLKHVSLEMESS
ncbi:centrosomal protein of 68 kDa isoform X1 [Pelobates fuscus]|uniref:centrosomal protein of 68 kDa isoform X1 n=1 Tax=Pelobates fuscus TaxID=191477 RepID=UPI002FE44082